jgi:hypothetical protein
MRLPNMLSLLKLIGVSNSACDDLEQWNSHGGSRDFSFRQMSLDKLCGKTSRNSYNRTSIQESARPAQDSKQLGEKILQTLDISVTLPS